MSFTVVIPARFASQRLPGKPLVDIDGQTMVERVYRRAERSEASHVVVATDDERIVAAVKRFGGNVVMTSDAHPSGTDRLQEVAETMGLSDEDIIVNVQGDEPLIPPAVINQVARNLVENDEASAATLSEAIYDAETVFDPNAVKVVCDNRDFALYFSRASIPWDREHYGASVQDVSEDINVQRHIGLYAYRARLLRDFVAWPPSMLEKIEKLEQLRILSNGKKIHVATACERVPAGVDTEEDLQRVRNLFA